MSSTIREVTECQQQVIDNVRDTCRNIPMEECLRRVRNSMDECVGDAGIIEEDRRFRFRPPPPPPPPPPRPPFMFPRLYMNANVEVTERSNNGKTATLFIYPNKQVIVTDGNEVISISRIKTDEISKLFLVEGLFWPTLNVIMSTENGDQKVGKVTSLKSVNHNGRKALEAKVSTSEYEGVDTTAKKALSLFDLSNKEDNATVTLISSTPSFNELLKSNLDNFRTLSTAIEAADLENDPRVQGLFDGTKEYTVFVPTDDAFSKLPDGTVTDLLKPKNRSKLRKILRNHIVPGALSAANIMKKKSIKTVDGKRLKIKVKDGKVYVGNARVITADVTVSNGYAHVINRVLLPE